MIFIFQIINSWHWLPYPIARWQILDFSKLKEFADDSFKFDEIGRKLFKQVENTVGNGEIACNKQFLFFPQCFQRACFPGASKGVIVWEWVNPFPNTPFLNRPKLKEAADDNWNVAIERFYDTHCIEYTVEKVKLLILSNFTFSHNVFLKLFSSMC